MLALSLDPLQGALAQEDILRIVDHTLVTVVNQVRLLFLSHMRCVICLHIWRPKP